MVVAVFLSNIPEGLEECSWHKGKSARYIFGIWTSITILCGLAALLGYSVFNRFLETFEQAHIAGLIAVGGFLLAFVLTKLGA